MLCLCTFSVAIVLFFFLVDPTSAHLVVTGPPRLLSLLELRGIPTTYQAPVFSRFTGPVDFRLDFSVAASAGSRCTFAAVAAPQTAIVFEASSHCTEPQAAAAIARAGASAALLLTHLDTPSPAGNNRYHAPGPALEIPLVAVERSFRRVLELLSQPGMDTAQLALEPSENPWFAFWESAPWTATVGCLACWALANCAAAAYKILAFATHRRRGLDAYSIPQWVCGLELLANCERLVYLLVDPMGSKGVLDVLQNSVLVSASVPVALATATLLLFVWLSADTKGSQTLNRYRLPVCLVIAFLFAMDLAFAVWRGLVVFSPVFAAVDAACYLAVYGTLVGVSAAYGLRRLRQVHALGAAGSSDKIKRRVERMTRLYLASNVAHVAFFAGAVLTATDFFFTFAGWIAVTAVCFGSMLASSSLQLAMLVTPERRDNRRVHVVTTPPYRPLPSPSPLSLPTSPAHIALETL